MDKEGTIDDWLIVAGEALSIVPFINGLNS